MGDARKFERSLAAYHAEVRRRDTGAIVGHLADISPAGIMLTAERPLAVGERVALAIELPRGNPIGRQLAVHAEVRWCEADLVPGLFSVGIAFTDDGPSAVEVHETLSRLFGAAR